jgi:hypothetical protein
MNDANCCRVCGFDFGCPLWGDDGQSPTYDICSCCGCEAGYEDVSLDSVRRYRQKWIAAGAQWFAAQERPDGWNLDEQLRHVPAGFR